MKPFYGEDEICVNRDCPYSGEHEIEFEQVEPGRETIIKICPLCGAASMVGQRVFGEEFYY